MNVETAKSNRPVATRSRWMVVDDDEDVLELTATLLGVIGDAEVHRFRSGTEALGAFNRAPDSFGLIITDLDMPGMSGIELCRRLRAQIPDLRILLATGGGLVTREEARRFGFCGLLRKPFPLAELRYAVNAAVSQSVHMPTLCLQ